MLNFHLNTHYKILPNVILLEHHSAEHFLNFIWNISSLVRMSWKDHRQYCLKSLFKANPHGFSQAKFLLDLFSSDFNYILGNFIESFEILCDSFFRARNIVKNQLCSCLFMLLSKFVIENSLFLSQQGKYILVFS